MAQTSTPFSVLILVKNRKDHLLNVLAGIEQSTRMPSEVIVVHMNEPSYETPGNLLVKHFEYQSKNPLPLAAARNYLAKQAQNEQLCFLDVDCIPDRTFFEKIMRESGVDAITMADPRYLQQPIAAINFNVINEYAQANPARADLAYGPSENYEMFWSLGFAINKATFERIGGFDESFTGYGGEDTDFALSARKHGIGMTYSKAKVFHQPHPEYDPPLNWLTDIVKNAQIFHDKWHIWPMRDWLDAFESSGYIKRNTNDIRVQRTPSDEAIKAALK